MAPVHCRHCVETPASVVQIKNLQLPCPVRYPNVWKIDKEQPGSLDVTLGLKTNFATVSEHDGLEDSVNYGTLSKSIRNALSATLAPTEILWIVQRCCLDLGGGLLSGISIELCLPKASMTGESLSFVSVSEVDDSGKPVPQRALFTVQDMHLMAIIGVNDYERTAKQPIMASMEFDYASVNTSQGDTSFPIGKAVLVEQRLQKV